MLNFKVGAGDTIVCSALKDGISYIRVSPNDTNTKFVNGQTMTIAETTVYNEQFDEQHSAVFEFTDFELGMKFYSGFFLESIEEVIQPLRRAYYSWKLANTKVILG